MAQQRRLSQQHCLLQGRGTTDHIMYRVLTEVALSTSSTQRHTKKWRGGALTWRDLSQIPKAGWVQRRGGAFTWRDLSQRHTKGGVGLLLERPLT